MNFKKQNVVQKGQRNMSNWDIFATWVGANANNGTWYVGGVIAACGFLTASKLLIITGLISYLFLVLVSLAGYESGLNTMNLMRGSFGIKGSLLPSIINVVQFIGWAGVNTYIAALSVSYVLKDIFKWPANNLGLNRLGIFIGIIIMAILHLISISLGEKSVKWIERIGIVLVTIFVVWESVLVLKMVPFKEIVSWQAPHNLRMASGTAIDTLLAFNLAWVTAAADFSSFAKKKSGATWWSFLGANIGLIWFALMGIVATIATAIMIGKFDPNNSDPSTIASKLGLGVLALVVIMLTSTTANAVNLMAAGSAVKNIFPKLKLKKALFIVTIMATIITFLPAYVATFLDSFELFLDGVGMFLGPEIAVFLVDYFVLHKRHYEINEFDQKNGRYWYYHGVNVVAFAAWIIGVVIYLLFKQMDFFNVHLGATVITIVLTAIIYWLGMKIFNRQEA